MKVCRVLLITIALAAPAFAQGPLARMIFYRHPGMSWFGGAPTVYLDEAPLARLSEGRCFYLDIAPTSHVFRSGIRGTPYILDFKAQQTYILRLDNGGFLQAPNDIGMAEVSRLFPVSPAAVLDLRVKLDRPFLMPVPQPPVLVPIRNSDVIQMTKGGLSEWIIIRKIRETPVTDFKVTAVDLVQLSESGVSELVINAMLDSVAAAAAKK